ncbi:ribonuclease D [Fretibacter rubidus]|uniref:ribonuclease D n=1 Tax=Fretibacter rubidus TaxID=570162 RepID=UPI00352A37FD
MQVIKTNEALTAFCNATKGKAFICVDTEFMRESTFYSQLCLIQAATDTDEAIIDPLADGLDLTPFLDVLMDKAIMKVMHAARQDMEIFYALCGAVPGPLFDTQIAAMALGFGDSVGYMALVKGRLDINLDKGARFTDWSRRPLSDKQLHYAIGDVTHLRDLYPGMVEELQTRGRLGWVNEEMAPQMDAALYSFEPETAWERLKVRNIKKPYLAALKAAAAWREREAISRDIPRRRVLKDDSLYDLAQNRPRDTKALERLRSIPKGFERSSKAKALVEAIAAAVDNAEDYAPKIERPRNMPPNLGPRMEMLKTLLRLRTEYEDIAPRLVANNSDIEQLAAFGAKADIAALKGWRREAFGEDALAMLAGKIALRLEGREVVAEPIEANKDA